MRKRSFLCVSPFRGFILSCFRDSYVDPHFRKLMWLAGLAVLLGLLTPAALFAAAPPFPRGPGFYYDPIKLGATIATFLLWVKLCAWIDLDAHRLKISSVTFWNGIV